ncbi:MAG: glycosyltransferase family 2 protein [Coriobacteriia bacterium]|nr:glycosyltransferase family 2 protein [Coriobacteriia bacterium]
MQNLLTWLSYVSFVDVFNLCIFIAFTVCYAYQLFYVLIGLTRKPRKFEAKKQHKFACLISARNESAVIGDLLKSIKNQDYPSELVDVFVIADNCDDNTAEIALRECAFVIERFNKEMIGKGFALNYGINIIMRDCLGIDLGESVCGMAKDGKILCPSGRKLNNGYEAFFVFDADNVLDKNYIAEMNKVYDNGYTVATSYRNTKNFDSNWISSGYATWFLREARFLSQPRFCLNTSCAVSGTGFFFDVKIMKKTGGWQWFLLTEDIEFATNNIIHGNRIGYAPNAVLYDEQPVTFVDSWNQRFRWTRGFYQVFVHYGWQLLKGIFTNKKGHKFACYDMLMTIAPGLLITVIAILFNLVIIILGLCGVLSAGMVVAAALSSICFCLGNYILFMFVLGMITLFVEWYKVRAGVGTKIVSMFTFPFFMLTYLPIAIVAVFKRVGWKPIKHTINVDVKDFE